MGKLKASEGNVDFPDFNPGRVSAPIPKSFRSELKFKKPEKAKKPERSSEETEYGTDLPTLLDDFKFQLIDNLDSAEEIICKERAPFETAEKVQKFCADLKAEAADWAIVLKNEAIRYARKQKNPGDPLAIRANIYQGILAKLASFEFLDLSDREKVKNELGKFHNALTYEKPELLG